MLLIHFGLSVADSSIRLALAALGKGDGLPRDSEKGLLFSGTRLGIELALLELGILLALLDALAEACVV